MDSLPALPVEDILASTDLARQGESIGRSREGRPIHGALVGTGRLRISLIAGCHADEPVGPMTLGALAAFLQRAPRHHPLLTEMTWRIVPHVNPDGERRNQGWSDVTVPTTDCLGRSDTGYSLGEYLQRVVRELPGDDIEFGFPRNDADEGARPENHAVARFLTEGAPYHLHGSLHGMALAPGPWFLLEPAWIERTISMREEIRRHVVRMSYRLYDPDRKGEKGFERIDRGFSTRPDSGAMKQFFERRGEPEVSARFRPSSMEFVRSLGGDPLTFVSEMPLFTTPGEVDGRPTGLEDLGALRHRLTTSCWAAADLEAIAVAEAVAPMPIRDQQRLQLILLEAALSAVWRAARRQ